jgi:hypothetical protein
LPVTLRVEGNELAIEGHEAHWEEIKRAVTALDIPPRKLERVLPSKISAARVLSLVCLRHLPVLLGSHEFIENDTSRWIASLSDLLSPTGQLEVSRKRYVMIEGPPEQVARAEQFLTRLDRPSLPDLAEGDLVEEHVPIKAIRLRRCGYRNSSILTLSRETGSLSELLGNMLSTRGTIALEFHTNSVRVTDLVGRAVRNREFVEELERINPIPNYAKDPCHSPGEHLM